MWDRKELKSKAKAAFKANYWRCVAVALIFALLVGGALASTRNTAQDSLENNETAVAFDLNGDGTLSQEEIAEALGELKDDPEAQNALLVILGAIVIGLAVLAIIGALVKILVYNPLELGCQYFFLKNSGEPAQLGALKRGFKPAWGHNVGMLFLRNLFLSLWTLLFIVPGIVKAFSYRMAPYIQAEHPEMKGTEAITLSRKMMKGHKWEAFVFDLSFLGWELLGALTFGIVGVLWARPYHEAANAELYQAIRDGYYGAKELPADSAE